jgi:hypothetical protein
VAVAAIDPDVGHVVLVAERHRLLDGDPDPGHVRGTHEGPDGPSQSGQDEDGAEDADLSEYVGAAVEDLSHQGVAL